MVLVVVASRRRTVCAESGARIAHRTSATSIIFFIVYLSPFQVWEARQFPDAPFEAARGPCRQVAICGIRRFCSAKFLCRDSSRRDAHRQEEQDGSIACTWVFSTNFEA